LALKYKNVSAYNRTNGHDIAIFICYSNSPHV
jgi:hypothetical protein